MRGESPLLGLLVLELLDPLVLDTLLEPTGSCVSLSRSLAGVLEELGTLDLDPLLEPTGSCVSV